MVGEASRRYLAAGLTTICDPQVTSREMQAYQLARARGELGIRTVMLPLSHQLDEYLAIGLVGPMGDDHLRIGGMKFYTDGAITGGTAVFSTPMGSRGQYAGTLYHEPAELADLLRRARRAPAGSSPSTPWATGRWGSCSTGWRRPWRPRRTATCATASSTDRGPRRSSCRASRRLGMVPVTQPGSIAELGDIWRDHLGDRVHRAMPLRDQLELGIRPAISSDAFVQSYRPLDTIAAAVLRRDAERRAHRAGPGAHGRGGRRRAHHQRRTGDSHGGSHRLHRGRQAGRSDGAGRRPAGRLRRGAAGAAGLDDRRWGRGRLTPPGRDGEKAS